MIKVTGLKELDAVFNEMPKSMTHKVLGTAGANAAKPLVEKAKLLAPEGPTGNLVDSIGVEKESFAKATEVGKVVAGPRRTRRYRGYAAHLVEKGTRQRYLTGRGKYRRGTNRGVMPAKPFMEPAYQATRQQIVGLYSTEVGKVLLRTMRRYIK
jgi:HK97 gp10 family phage protein